jgi:DnaJ-class molecular chaperone
MIYVITAAPDGRLSCACKGFTYRGTCRHLKALAAAPFAVPVTEACDVCDLYGASTDCRTCQGAGVIPAARS